MPITYESPEPVAAAASIYTQAAQQAARQRQLQGVAAAATHGRGGYGDTPYDTGIQDAIQFRDQSQFREQADDMSRQVNARDVFQAAEAQSKQRNEFALQAQLEQTRLTQHEHMRLQRMQNSLGMVASDANLSDGEKNEIIAQLKYQISPLQMRLANEKLQQEQLLKQSMVDQNNAKAAMNENNLKVATAKFNDRKHYDIPDNVLSQIVEDYKNNTPMAHLVPPEAFEAMARQEAIRQGLGEGYMIESVGPNGPVWKSMKAMSGKGTGHGEIDHPTGLSPQEYSKIREHAITQIQREQQATVTDELNNKKPKHPELDTPEGYNKRMAELMKGLPADFGEYMAQGKAKPKGYVSRFAKPPQVAAAATPDANKNVQAIYGQVDLETNRLAARTDLPGPVKMQAYQSLQTMRRLLAKSGGNLDTLQAEDKQQFDEAKKYIDDNVPEQKTQLPQPAAPPPQPAAAATPGSPGFFDKLPSERFTEAWQGVLNANPFDSGARERRKKAGQK